MDYYKILDVSPDADVAAIDKAFKLMSLKHHPDKANVATRPAGAESQSEREDREKRNNERYVNIVNAREVLTDPAKRREYDLQREMKGKGAQSTDNHRPHGDYHDSYTYESRKSRSSKPKERRYSTADEDYHNSSARSAHDSRRGKSSKPTDSRRYSTTDGDYNDYRARTPHESRKSKNSKSTDSHRYSTADNEYRESRTRTPHGDKKSKSSKSSDSRRHSTANRAQYDSYPRPPRDRRSYTYDTEDRAYHDYDGEDRLYDDYNAGNTYYGQQYDARDHCPPGYYGNEEPYRRAGEYQSAYYFDADPGRYAPPRPSHARRASYAHAAPSGAIVTDTAITASMAELTLESVRVGTVDSDVYNAQSRVRRIASSIPSATYEEMMHLLERARSRNKRCRAGILDTKQRLEDLREEPMDSKAKYREQQVISGVAIERARDFVNKAGSLMDAVTVALDDLMRAGRRSPHDLPLRICALLDRYPRP